MKRYEDFGTGSPIESDHRITDEPKYKVIATGEIINFKPAHERYATGQGSGSSIRVAAKDAIDALFRHPKVKALRNKLPIKVTLQDGN